MALGSERSLLIRNPLKRAVVARFGDTHFGRVLRFFYFARALDRLALQPGSILDAGCGKGYFALYLARRFPGARIVAMDLGRADLGEAERIRRAAGIGNVVFAHGDIQGGLGNERFDLIVSSEVLEYVPDEMRALRNLCDALRPGGALLIHLMHAEGAYRRTGVRRLFHRRAEQWRDDGMVRAGYTETGLAAQLAHAGFADVSVQPTFGPVGMFAHSCFELGRTWPAPLYLAMFPVLVLLARWDARARIQSGGGMLATGMKRGSSAQ